MHLKYIFTCLAVGSIAANIGACASTNANSESRLYFKSQANEFEIAPRCLRSVSMNEDKGGRALLTLDFFQSAKILSQPIPGSGGLPGGFEIDFPGDPFARRFLPLLCLKIITLRIDRLIDLICIATSHRYSGYQHAKDDGENGRAVA